MLPLPCLYPLLSLLPLYSINQLAAAKGITQVVVSRIIMAAPGMTILPVVMERLEKQAWLRRNPRLNAPFQTLACGLILTFMTPTACSLFNQKWWGLILLLFLMYCGIHFFLFFLIVDLMWIRIEGILNQQLITIFTTVIHVLLIFYTYRLWKWLVIKTAQLQKYIVCKHISKCKNVYILLTIYTLLIFSMKCRILYTIYVYSTECKNTYW